MREREVAPGVHVLRRPWLDLNLGLVVGERSVMLVDTGISTSDGVEVARIVAALTPLPLEHVVVTHWHWDHAFGSAAFADATVWAHPETICRLSTGAGAAAGDARHWLPRHTAAIDATVVRVPDAGIADHRTLDLGGRPVEVRFLGPGHTGGDLVVSVPDASVAFAGDLVEESGPPQFDDAYPEQWPTAVERLLDLGVRTVVPGHGREMDQVAVAAQHAELSAVATAVGAGRSPSDPASPYPPATMHAALSRAGAEPPG